jgi:DNA-binding NarL/FixJ family response regulator
MKPKIKILIADDHAIVRIGLSALLKTESDLSVVGVAKDGEEAVAEALRLNPDVSVMDLMMPKKNGVEATAEIHERLPGTKIIILTTFAASDGIKHALDAGATGAVMKTAEDAELVSIIRTVAAGGTVISDEIQQLLTEDPPAEELTPRQLEILESVTRGFTNADIAKQLGLREQSVKEHISAILVKIGAANRSEAVAIAMRKHLLKF